MSLRRLFAAATLAILAAGCAAQGTRTGAQQNVVTAEDLARAGHVSLYEALERIRPSFLRSPAARGAVTPQQRIEVYIGGMHMDGFDHLREIMAQNVAEVRFLNPSQANARFGGRNNGGALVITMK